MPTIANLQTLLTDHFPHLLPMPDLLTTIPAAEISIPQINALHTAATQLAEEARIKANAATSMALLIGLKLTALKAATPHGQWEKLFKSAEKPMRNVTKPGAVANRKHVSDLIDFDVRTARNYISVVAEVMNRRLTAEQSSALVQIAAMETLPPAEAALLEEITPPESLRQLYLEMNIIKPTKKELYARTKADAAETHDKTPPQPPTIASIIESKQIEAHLYWYGTESTGYLRDSLYALLEHALREGLTGRLSRLDHESLATLHDLFTDLAKQTKTILSQH